VGNVRVETARHRLEQTTDTIDAIARTSGFGTSETMRRTFVRHLRVTPDQYRRHFALQPDPNQ
jgi:transcriptional regulator GlxA family with amidase domain